LRDRSAGCAGKDRAKCIGLLIVRALIDIRAQLPIAFPHWARRVDYERHVVSTTLSYAPFSMWKINATSHTPSVGREVKGGALDTKHGHMTLQLQFSK